MAAKYVQTFTVSGEREFPIDMLRYDDCKPATERDSIAICGTFSQRMPLGLTTVELRRSVEIKAAVPTDGRWRSYGWVVNFDSLKTFK